MVRVGGGWVALDEFLQKNDPCRGKFTSVIKHKKLYTNIKFCVKIISGLLIV